MNHFRSFHFTELRRTKGNITKGKTVTLSGIHVYPNPVVNPVMIDNLPVIRKTIITIYDNSGRIVFKQAFNNHAQAVIDLSSFAYGFYILRLSDEKSIITKPLIVCTKK